MNDLNPRLRERLTDIKAEIALLESADLSARDAGHLDALREELAYWLPLLAPADATGDWLQSLRSK